VEEGLRLKYEKLGAKSGDEAAPPRAPASQARALAGAPVVRRLRLLVPMVVPDGAEVARERMPVPAPVMRKRGGALFVLLKAPQVRARAPQDARRMATVAGRVRP
jgi:hypothetical protein